MRQLVFIFLLLFSLTTYAATEERAIFAGGCFWCMQPPYDKLPGVRKTVAGFIGGTTPNPTYKMVSSARTKYTEAIEVYYDPAKISYRQLLTVYWRNVDPTRNDGQFCDNGRQYRPGIFYITNAQKEMALSSKQWAEKTLKTPIKVEVTQAGTFYPAEEYHQYYYKKNPIRYHYYRYQCGRDKRLEEIWGSQS